MKRFLLCAAFCLGGVISLFPQQKMDVNGDGSTETVFNRAGKKFFYRMEFDLDLDGKNDIAMLIDDNTGEPTSLDVVRSTWPVPANIGSPAWIAAKRTAAAQFWKDRGNSAICDTCNAGMEKGQGYVLSPEDILANLRYVNYHVYHEDPLASLFPDENFNEIEASLLLMETMFKSGAFKTPWLLCEDCIAEWIALAE